MSPGWHALGYPTTSVERASGQHAKDLLVIIEEASGVEDEIWNALYSRKYSKLVAIGNPIRAEGRFVDLIRQADKDREDCIPPNKAVYAIRIPSTESPHAYLEKSPYGLADRIWLEACYRHYGSNSLWVGSHIDARIPELSADVLMSKAPFQARVGKAWDDRAGLPGFLRENGGLNPVRRTELRGGARCLVSLEGRSPSQGLQLLPALGHGQIASPEVANPVRSLPVDFPPILVREPDSESGGLTLITLAGNFDAAESPA